MRLRARRHARRPRQVRPGERGASSVEYALVVSLIAVVIIASVTLLGGSTKNLFSKTCASVASAASSTC